MTILGIRASTIALVVAFAAIFTLYLLVRPPPEPAAGTAAANASAATTTTRRTTTTSTAPAPRAPPPRRPRRSPRPRLDHPDPHGVDERRHPGAHPRSPAGIHAGRYPDDRTRFGVQPAVSRLGPDGRASW